MNKYFKPKSLTWLSGICLIGYGILSQQLEAIFSGLGIIGLRGAIKK